MAKLVTTLRLTNIGRQKLEALIKKIKPAGDNALVEGTKTITKPEIVARAPTPDQEATIISKPGVPTGGRYLKAHGQQWVRDGIAHETPVKKVSETYTEVSLGDSDKVSQYIGFGWSVIPSKEGQGRGLKRRPMRTTKDLEAGPFWKQLLFAFCHGGTTRVTPRGPNIALSLDEDVYRKSKVISIPPFLMYSKGYRATKKKLQDYVKKNIQKVLK